MQLVNERVTTEHTEYRGQVLEMIGLAGLAPPFQAVCKTAGGKLCVLPIRSLTIVPEEKPKPVKKAKPVEKPVEKKVDED